MLPLQRLPELLPESMTQRLAGVLLHFVWQGLAITVVLALIVSLGRVRRPASRYACSLVALLMMVACPVCTYFALETTANIPVKARSITSQPGVVAAIAKRDGTKSGELSFINPTTIPVVTRPAATVSLAPQVRPESRPAVTLAPPADPQYLPYDLKHIIGGRWQAVQPWLVTGWFFGVGLLSLRLLLGWAGVWRLRQQVEALPDAVTQRVHRLAAVMNAGLPLVRLSQRLTEAIAVGFLRPMILLPVAWITELPPDMLDAVIAHELAHVRRGDLWINLLQRLIETLLFYHPAVWWLSRRMRIERELCCDEWVVRVTQNRLRYAETLEHIGRLSLRGASVGLAVPMASPRAVLLHRIRHILNLQPRDRSLNVWLSGALPLLIAGLLWWSATLMGNRAVQADDLQKQADTARAAPGTKAPLPPIAKASPEPLDNDHRPIEYPDLKLLEQEFGGGPFQHDHAVNNIGWLDEGRSLLTSSGHGLRVWDVASQQVKWEMRKVGDNTSLATVDRAGTRIVTLGEWADPVLIEWPSGKVLRKFKESWITDRGEGRVTGSPQALSLSPDGKKVAMAYINTGNHGYLRIYDADNGALLVHRNGPPTPALAWSPDSQLLAVGEQRGIVIFLRPDGSLQRPGIRLAEGDVPLGLAFNEDGKQLAMVTYLGTCSVFKMQDRSPMWTWKAPPKNGLGGVSQAFGGVTFTRDQSKVFVRSVQTSMVFNAANGQVERELKSGWGNANFAASPREDVMAISTSQGRVDILNTNSLRSTIPNTRAIQPAIHKLRVRPDGQQILAMADRQLLLLNSQTLAIEGQFDVVSDVEDACWSPDGHFIALVRDKRGPETADVLHILEVTAPASEPVKRPLLQPSRHVLSVIQTLPGNEYTMRGIAFTPDSTRLAVAGVRDVTLWNHRTGDLIWRKRICEQTEWLERLAVSPQGDMIAATVFQAPPRGEVRGLRTADGEALGKVATAGQPTRLLFTDATTLLTLVDTSGTSHQPDEVTPLVEEWNVTDWKPIPGRTIAHRHAPFFSLLDFQPGSNQLLCSLPISELVASDTGLFDAVTHSEIHHFHLPGAIRDAQFLPGNRLAFVKGNGSIMVLKSPPNTVRLQPTAQVTAPGSNGTSGVQTAADATPANPDAAPQTSPARPPGTENHIIVRGHVIDDATEQPIEEVAWVGGMLDPKNPGQVSWGYSYQAYDDLRGSPFEKWLSWHTGDRMRVLAPGYQPQSILETLPDPLPADRIVNVTVRLKRGRVVTGVVLDHTGKPVPNAKVFYVPENHRTNIAEGIPGANDYDPRDPVLSHRDKAVMEVVTDPAGKFAISTEAAGKTGRLAVSCPEVDLCPFEVPADDQPVKLKLPAPTTLEIDWSLSYLDSLAKEKINPWQTDDPRYCVYYAVRLGTDKNDWKGVYYQRTMLVRAPQDGPDKLARGVTQEEASVEVLSTLPDGRTNRTLSGKTKIIGLPAGYYEISRKEARENLVTHRVEIRAGQVVKLEEKRGRGAAVFGKAVLPPNTVFTRQEGEASKPLTWDLVHYRILTIVGINGDVQTPMDATMLGPQGEFSFRTHLPPGEYLAGIRAYLPESDERRRFSGYILPELDASLRFTISPEDSNPVNLTIPVLSRSSRITQIVQGEKNADAGTMERGLVQLLPLPAVPAADPQKPWSVHGQVLGADGQPIRGVTVTAHTGMHTLKQSGATETDEEGRYTLTFGPGVLTANDEYQTQWANITVQHSGMFERSLNRQGKLVAALKLPEEKRRLGRPESDFILPGESRQIDFVLQTAAKVSGTLIGEDEKPVPNFDVALTGEQLTPPLSIATAARTDERGRFTLANVPPGYKFQFQISSADRNASQNAWVSGPFEFKVSSGDQIFVQEPEREVEANSFEIQIKGQGTGLKLARQLGGQLQKFEPNGDYLTGEARLHAASIRLELNTPPDAPAPSKPRKAGAEQELPQAEPPLKPVTATKYGPAKFEGLVRDDLKRAIPRADVVLCRVQTVEGRKLSEVIATGRADATGRYSLTTPEDARQNWQPATQGVVWAMARGYGPGIVQFALGNVVSKVPEQHIDRANEGDTSDEVEDPDDEAPDYLDPFVLYRDHTVEVEVRDEMGRPLQGHASHLELESLPVPDLFFQRMITGPTRKGMLEIKHMPRGHREGSPIVRTLSMHTESHGKLEFTWNADRASEQDGRVREGAQPVKLIVPGASQITGRLAGNAGGIPRELIANVEIGMETFHGDSSLQTPWCRGAAVVKTDADGRFIIPHLASGRIVKIRAKLPAGTHWKPLLAQRDEVVLKPGETTQLDIPLVATRTLRGVARRPMGDGIPGVEFAVSYGALSPKQPVTGQSRSSFEFREIVRTDAEGKFSVEVIPGEIALTKKFSPGSDIETAELWPVSSGFPEWKAGKILHLPGDSKPFDLPPLELNTYRGILLDEAGKPVKAVLAIKCANQLGGLTETQDDGTFVVEVLGKPVSWIAARDHEQGDFNLPRTDSPHATVVSESPLVLQIKSKLP